MPQVLGSPGGRNRHPAAVEALTGVPDGDKLEEEMPLKELLTTNLVGLGLDGAPVPQKPCADDITGRVFPSSART